MRRERVTCFKRINSVFMKTLNGEDSFSAFVFFFMIFPAYLCFDCETSRKCVNACAHAAVDVHSPRAVRSLALRLAQGENSPMHSARLLRSTRAHAAVDELSLCLHAALLLCSWFKKTRDSNGAHHRDGWPRSAGTGCAYLATELGAAVALRHPSETRTCRMQRLKGVNRSNGHSTVKIILS